MADKYKRRVQLNFENTCFMLISEVWKWSLSRKNESIETEHNAKKSENEFQSSHCCVHCVSHLFSI